LGLALGLVKICSCFSGLSIILSGQTKPLRVLMVEDSEDHALLMTPALREGAYEPEHEWVKRMKPCTPPSSRKPET
jgi:hypothetical protein